MINKFLYITITNQCNYSCETCQIGCNDLNDGFMSFQTLQKILCEDTLTPLTIIFDGGEPFLHSRIYLFLEYLSSVCNFKNIIIKTNGTVLFTNDEILFDIVQRLQLNLSLDILISTNIITQNKEHLTLCKKLLDENKFNITFNVKYVSEEDKDFLKNKILSVNIPLEVCKFSVVESYGLLKNSDYPKLNKSDENIVCYASDGTNFGNDFSARADYEIQLSQNKIPVFDSIHHRGMWLNSKSYITSISFENKDDITLSLLEFQKEYIELHCNRFTENMINEGYTSYAEYYSSLFDDGKEHNPFISSDVFEKTTVQEIFLLTELMFTTLDLQRFYMYKEKAIQLCSTVAYLPIKPDIKITDSRYCCKNI